MYEELLEESIIIANIYNLGAIHIVELQVRYIALAILHTQGHLITYYTPHLYNIFRYVHKIRVHEVRTHILVRESV